MWQGIASSLRLSVREVEVIRLMFEDEAMEEIALKLKIPISTVRSCIERIYQKLEVHDRVRLVLCLLEAAEASEGRQMEEWR